MPEAIKEGVIKPPVSEEETELFKVFIGKRSEKGKTLDIGQATQRLRQGEVPNEFKEFSQVLEVKRGLDTKGLSFIVESLTEKGFDREEVELHIYCKCSRDRYEDSLGGYLNNWGYELEKGIERARESAARVRGQPGFETSLQSHIKAEKESKAEIQLQKQVWNAWREGNFGLAKQHLLHKQESALETLTLNPAFHPFVADILPIEAGKARIGSATERYIDAGIEYLLTKHLLKEARQGKGKKE